MNVHFFRLLFLSSPYCLTLISTDDQPQYSYENIARWPCLCNSGIRQSPIDITKNDTVVRNDIPTLNFIGYDSDKTIYMENYAYSVRAINFDNWCPQRPHITGGGLMGKYNLINIHFHWSQSILYGSEHLLNGHSFVSEVHMLHVKEGYDTDDDIWPEGMFAAVTIFVAVSNDETNFKNLTDIFKKLREVNSTAIVQNFRPQVLLPYDTSTFYRYDGSLTTPPCTEKVTWFVMGIPISITNEQLFTMQQIKLEYGRIGVNTRTSMPLNGRVIYYRPRGLANSRTSTPSVFMTFLRLTALQIFTAILFI